MTDVNLVNLEKTITKQDWISIIKWINVRWNTGWTDQDIKSLYEDYKVFPTDLILLPSLPLPVPPFPPPFAPDPVG